MSEVTKKELAAILGISDRQINNLEKDGMPVKVKAGKGKQNLYDTKACIDWRVQKMLDAYLDGSEEAKNNIGVAYKKSAHKLKEAQAQREELRLAKERGELLHIQEVDEAWSEIIASIRNQMLNLPLRAYKSFIRQENESKVIELLEKYAHEILRNLSKRPSYEAHEVQMEPVSDSTTQVVDTTEEEVDVIETEVAVSEEEADGQK